MTKFQRDSGWVKPEAVATLPSFPGAYGLVIRLPVAFSGDIGALGPVTLSASNYLYLGSAYGPGGVAARLRRHLRRGKKLHWHVDYLTEKGSVTRLFVMQNGRECDLVDVALTLPGARVRLAGFGSSDCRRCKAHLLDVGSVGAPLFDALAALV